MTKTSLPLMLIVLLLPGLAGAQTARQPSPAEIQFFETKVRPVLAEHCIHCHGPKKQSGGFRLDSRTAILEESDHGPIVVPGQPDKSALVRAIKHEGAIKMPKKGKLAAEAIVDLTAWVKMGAPWPDSKPAVVADANAKKKHWAFQPVRKPAVPNFKRIDWPTTAIDAFVLARLDEAGLAPSPLADPRTLIRRMTFDLIGLPPTPEEVEEFVKAWASATPQAAVERTVDRLLASPQYGERWGRHWLDVARYADTKGYILFEESPYPWAYTYRDYVIQALNDDVPYDRFVLEQLVADQLPLGENKQALRALGFLTLGSRFMNNQHDIIDDRIDVVTRGLMGLTVTCARCHDHKYDPISQKDYYSLYGVFASCAEPTVPPLFEPAPQTEVYAKFDKELKRREARLTDFVKMKHSELTKNARKRVAEYLLAAHALRDQPGTDDFMLLADPNDLNPTMIVRYQRYLQHTAKSHHPVFAPWHAFADLPAKEFAEHADKILSELRQPKQPINVHIAKAILDQPPKNMSELAQRYAFVLLTIDKNWQEQSASKKQLDDPAEEELRLVFYGPDAPANVTLLLYGDLSLLPDRASQGILNNHRSALEQWRATGPGAPPRAHVLEDLAMPLRPYVFLRGNPSQKGESLDRRLPALLDHLRPNAFERGSGRLELARAVIDPANPLTARVLVNRIWQHHFGTGLVRTPSDFGLRSDPPSHPELLDYLAAAFIEKRWSLKELHRMIVLSRVYLQKSDDRPDGMKVDPENRLLWKWSRQRLDFEATRDALLAVTGRLDRKIGGPSVGEPLALTANRRTLYNYLDRLNVPGLFRTFDFPNPDATTPQRENTTIAPQALFMMNHPFVMECARNVMKRADVAQEEDGNRKMDRLYRILFGRPPSAAETLLARRFIEAEKSTAVAWERYVHALLQTNEFCWVD